MIQLTHTDAHVFLSVLERAAVKLDTAAELDDGTTAAILYDVARELRREIIEPLRRLLQMPLREIAAVCEQIEAAHEAQRGRASQPDPFEVTVLEVNSDTSPGKELP